MSQQVTNFARFYATFNRLEYRGDKEELKQLMVLRFTKDRTSSLREMTQSEYVELCNAIEQMAGTALHEQYVKLKKKKRSAVLHQMQIYGVDTTSWEIVDRFCLNPRIAGKQFRYLEIEELEQLYKKLKMMIKKHNEQ